MRCVVLPCGVIRSKYLLYGGTLYTMANAMQKFLLIFSDRHSTIGKVSSDIFMATDMTFTATLPQSFLTTSGQDIDLFPVPSSELTVAQAAKILDMSEGCINELLNDGIIAFRQEKDKRWVQRDSFLEFEQEYREQGEALADIARWSQEMGLYD
jgi:hypothetical protein